MLNSESGRHRRDSENGDAIKLVIDLHPPEADKIRFREMDYLFQLTIFHRRVDLTVNIM